MLPTSIQDDVIVMVDQRKLPGEEVYVRCRTVPEVAKAIRTMVIRGAPAIGVAAAYGLALGSRRCKEKGTRQFAVDFQKNCDLMAATRPTAVNLFWAIDRMKRAFADGAQAGSQKSSSRGSIARRGQYTRGLANCRPWAATGAMVKAGAACDALQRRRASRRRVRLSADVIRAAVGRARRSRLRRRDRPFMQGPAHRGEPSATASTRRS